MTRLLPRNWEDWALADVGVWSGGGTPSSSNPEFWDGSIPWVSPKDMKVGIITSSQKRITEAALNNSAAKLIPAHSVLLVTRSGILAHSFPVATNRIPVTVNQDLKAITPVEVIDPEYLAYVLRFCERPILGSCSKHGTTVHSIEIPALRSLRVPIAPLREQRRIVAKIEELFIEVDKGAEALTKAHEQIVAYRKSVLRSAFLGELSARDVNPWTECTVGQLVTDIRYGTAKKCTVDPEKTPVLRIPNIASGRIDLTDLKHTDFTAEELAKLRLEDGDILLVRSNGSASLVGLSAVVTDNAVGYAYAGYLIRLRLKKEIILPEFLHLYFHSPVVRAQIESHARSTSGVHNINSDEIKAIGVRVPAISAQRTIVDAVSRMWSEIDALDSCSTTELQRSAALRHAILEKAFSGQLVPQDAKDEPAAVLLERVRTERGSAVNKRSRNNKNGKKEAA